MSMIVKVISLFGITTFLVLGTGTVNVWADDEQTLDKKAATMNAESSTPKHDAARVQALSKQYNVPEARISEMRSQKMGWGEVNISLAMAEHLSATSKTPMTTDQALTKIEQLRGEKMGWGKIAKELNMKLGPVVSAAERGERKIHDADRDNSRAGHDVTGERAEKRAEKMERSERHERPEKMERSERPERPERADRSARPERPGR